MPDASRRAQRAATVSDRTQLVLGKAMLDLESTAGLFDRDLPHDCRQALFGGSGAVRVWSLAASPMRPFTAVLACELEAGGRVGAHVQEHDPEIVIGLSGRGKALVEGHPQPLAAGRVVELPRGYTLALENESTECALRYLIVKVSSP